MKQIKTFARIEKMALSRRSILWFVAGGKDRIIPAAFMRNMPAWVVHNALEHGQLFEYNKGQGAWPRITATGSEANVSCFPNLPKGQGVMQINDW